jgi:poly(A) polymerase
MESEQIKNLHAFVHLHPFFKTLLQLSREAGIEIYLVGGLVRDTLLGRETQDVDLTLSRDALATALRFAEQTGGTFVLLKEEKETARVVLQGWNIDFAQFRAPDLRADLHGRDFTINAIALPLTQAFAEGDWLPYDPLCGMRDLKDRVLRMTGPNSFPQDPLRLLRAFRLMAQLDLTIDAETRQAIKKWASLLRKSASERIHYEWNLLLAQPDSARAFKFMDEDSLAEVLFPDLTLLKGINPKGYHHLDVFQHSVLTLQCLEDLLQGRILLPKDLEREMRAYIDLNRNLPVLKWAALFHDLGKIDTKIEAKGKMTFYGHEEFSLNRFEGLAERYRLSHREKELIGRLIGRHMRPHFLLNEKRKGLLSRRALLRFIREAGEELAGLFLLSLADSLAAQGREKPEEQDKLLESLWVEAIFLREEVVRPMVKRTPLISGRDLIALGLKPGPMFKKILESVQESYWSGEISTRDEALAKIKENFYPERAKV